MLRDLLRRRVEYAERDGRQYFDAAQNARLVADAERYYRTMYYGGSASWNLRDQHMFDTLQALLEFHGPQSKAIVWEHNFDEFVWFDRTSAVRPLVREHARRYRPPHPFAVID